MQARTLVKPVKPVELVTDVMLHPRQLNNDIYLNLKANLKALVEGRCTTDALVLNVHKVIDYNQGTIEAENFSGAVRFKVRYLATVCNPVQHMLIVGTVSEDSIPTLLVIEHGPIKVVVRRIGSSINTSRFAVTDTGRVISSETKQEVGPGTTVKVMLSKVLIKQRAEKILCDGYLDGIATPEEALRYGYVQTDITERPPVAAVVMNEDAV